ncbi:MAG: nicotinamide-nucleotide amidohydrolase family protein, partial [Myxococcota bacterium]
ERMEKRFTAAKFKLTPNNIRQVQVPDGSVVLRNDAGLAPGFEIVLNEVPIVCMPGVPREMHAIFESGVKPRLIALRESRGEKIERIARRIYRSFGAGESHVATRLGGVMDGVAGGSLHFQTKFPEVLAKVVIRDRDQTAADRRLAELDSEIRARLAPHVYGTDDDSIAAAVGRALRAADATVATAESCTGGLIGGLLTEVPGSSAYFAGGAITYSNEEKVRQLGVAPATVQEHGAVSEACVREMAQGARERFGTDYAVAVSGVAGPGGGSPDKPVGTVWLAAAGPGGVITKQLSWPSSRQRIRQLSVYWSLALLLRAIGGEDSTPATGAGRADEVAATPTETEGVTDDR